MKGAALTPDERAAMHLMPGGVEALRVPAEEPAGAVARLGKTARKTAARKVREAAGECWKPTPRPPPTPPKGKGKDKGKKGAKGQVKGKRRIDDAGNELCFSFNNKSGVCAAGLPGGR
eukprot:16247290-Heterocapsa_arctica.AAC.1